MNPPAQPAAGHQKWWLAGVVAALILGLGLLWQPSERPAVAPPAPAPAATRVSPPAVPPVPVERVDHPVIAAAVGLLADDGSAADDLEILTLILGDYRKALGANPVGENEEIAAALLGDNPKGLRFLPQGHRALDTAGRLCDRWGTPLFFHALSARHLAIRSAGPDRHHGTADDLASSARVE